MLSEALHIINLHLHSCIWQTLWSKATNTEHYAFIYFLGIKPITLTLLAPQKCDQLLQKQQQCVLKQAALWQTWYKWFICTISTDTNMWPKSKKALASFRWENNESTTQETYWSTVTLYSEHWGVKIERASAHTSRESSTGTDIHKLMLFVFSTGQAVLQNKALTVPENNSNNGWKKKVFVI